MIQNRNNMCEDTVPMCQCLALFGWARLPDGDRCSWELRKQKLQMGLSWHVVARCYLEALGKAVLSLYAVCRELQNDLVWGPLPLGIQTQEI